MGRSNRLTKEEIKHDQFVESTLKSYGFIRDNLKTIVIIAVVVTLGAAGLRGYRSHQQTRHAKASAAFNQALKIFQEAENNWLNAEKADDAIVQFKTAGTDFQEVFQQYSGTVFADKARYNYAKTLYFLEDYQAARTQFQSITQKVESENQMVALYAQEAIGNCLEQEGKYEEAIQAYQEESYPPTPQLPITVREFALANAKYNQALCYEKLGQTTEALSLYEDLIDQFRENLEKAIQQKSFELILDAKELIDLIPEPLVMSEAQGLESEGRGYDALISYYNSIRNYKFRRDVEGGLDNALRKQIRNFESRVSEFVKHLKNARKNESESGISLALYYYNQAVGLDFAPSRSLYEKALLQRDKNQLAHK
ncbi:MAG: tetratricopeptide repeat protein [Candidatus Poribacteria bacterium]|nr:tetratricopeptide repeat protein [Candidatus Poribacteria bacterium]MDE0505895.1 tetratricopeptide repeat protein [Candidatus Poribacteria bacterium]